MKKYPTRIEDLSDVPCFMILIEVSITIPGDERSRTNPGHGYPKHTVDSWAMEVYEDELSWKIRIESLEKDTGYRKRFKAVKMIPAKIDTTVKVTVEE